MTAIAVLSAVRERLAYLLAGDEGPPAVLKFKQLLPDLDEIQKFLLENPNSVEYKEKSSGAAGRGDNIAERVVQLAYQVEDAVESRILQEVLSSRSGRAGGGGAGGLIKLGLLKFPSTKISRHHQDDFQSLKLKIEHLLKICENEAGKSVGDSRRNSSVSVVVDSSNDDGVEEKTVTTVGMEDDFDTLRYILMNDDDRYPSPAISICGLNGIGKTTLARMLYEDPSVALHFDSRAWAHVGEEFQARDIAGAILVSLSSSAGSTKDDIAKMETTELMEQLYKAQKGRRCLVVLDDVWSPDAWETIRFAFPLDAGTRILITTRIREVAKQVNGYTHEMKMLNEDQSWELLKIQSGVQDPDVEEIGRQIARQCEGIPLALSVVGGMLRGKKLEDWKETQKSLREFENISTHEKILALSFNNLPLHLKPCFLYLGHFPPEQLIPVEKLYLLWMAEGLISIKDCENAERMKIAKGYLSELADRRLVFVHKEDFSGTRKFKSCELHHLIREFCIAKAKQEGFLGVVDFASEKCSLTRRVAMYLDAYKGNGGDCSINSELKNIRSFLFFDRDESHLKSMWPSEVADLKEYRMARVLDFDRVDFHVKKLPKGIEKLHFLRHLSFRECYLEELPSSFGNFPFLETLDLFVTSSCKMTIPNVLKNMSSLRHLYFPLAFQSATNEKLKLDTLKRLQILENFHAGVCDADDLGKLENLQIFKGISDGNNADIKKIIGFVNENKNLRHSSLAIKNYDCYSSERLSILENLILQCDALPALDIEGHLGKLPKMGPNFCELVFNGSEFSEDPMSILGKLPNLKSLVLCNDAFVGKEMKCLRADFPKLKSLKLMGMRYLQNWVVEDESMPCLCSLTIEKCKKLQELPYEIMDIPTLEEVKVGAMPKGFQTSVRQLAEEQRDLGNEVLCVTFY